MFRRTESSISTRKSDEVVTTAMPGGEGGDIRCRRGGAGGGMTRVAVLGTGIMGSAMARNLLGAGLAVTVCDRSPEAAAALARGGARAAGSPAEAVRGADVVITTLPAAAAGEALRV